MFLSFGLTGILAISVFVSINLYTARNSGSSVRNQARAVVTALVKHSLSSTAQYVAQTMTKKFNNIGGAGSLIAEAVLDRWVGYPSEEGWEMDAHVPFRDSITGLNKYPLDLPPLPLEWNITNNVNQDNAQEHLPDRPLGWYQPDLTNVSTISPSYYMQGLCNPAITDSNHPAYYPDCTEENNNLRTGGVVQPTLTNYYLASKAKDIGWVLKPLLESHSDVKAVGMFFANDGAGAVVQYPATVYDGTQTYTSIGCDWMNAIHPRTNAPIGTPEQIARCHRDGETVTMREYSPIERGWCKDQVKRDIDLANNERNLASDNVVSTGPYLDALSTENLWVLSFGRAVFDRMTNQFIGCSLVDVSAEKLYDILLGSSRVGSTTESALIRWDEIGTVVVATKWNPNVEVENAYVTDTNLNLGIDVATYSRIYKLIDYGSEWDPQEVLTTYQETFFRNRDRLIMVHPVPNVPKEYDPTYRPEYCVIISIDDDEAYGLVDEMDDLILSDVKESWKGIGIVGGVGLGVVILMITFIAATLTKPLRWMQKVAGLIIDNAGGQDLKEGLAEEMESPDAHPCCSPRTEVTYLLGEFVNMINQFSAEGAAEVAGLQVNEVQNRFEWRKLYEDLYPWQAEAREKLRKMKEEEMAPGPSGIPKQLSISKTASHDTFEDELTTESTMHTGFTRESVISQVSSLIPTSVTTHPTVVSALSRMNPLVEQVKGYAVKAGLMKEPDKEKIISPPKTHFGQNIVLPKDPMKEYLEAVSDNPNNSVLFWYITLLLGAPILVTAILITVFTATDTTDNIPVWLDDVRERSVEIERESINTAAMARALFGREVMARFIRDLHLYTRVAGWLMFGALSRSESFTSATTGADMCKYFENSSQADLLCEYAVSEDLSPCACEWTDPREGDCTWYNDSMIVRQLQTRFYEGKFAYSDLVNLYGTLPINPILNCNSPY